MEWWQWLITIGMPALAFALGKASGPLLSFLKGRAELSQQSRQDTIDEYRRYIEDMRQEGREVRASWAAREKELTTRVAALEKEHQACLEKAAVQGERLASLNDRVGRQQAELERFEVEVRSLRDQVDRQRGAGS